MYHNLIYIQCMILLKIFIQRKNFHQDHLLHQQALIQKRITQRRQLSKARAAIENDDTYNTRISRRVTIVTWCHNCDAVCHNCDILFVKMLELGSEIIPKN